MYGYIYLTTNLINNKKYIGQHKASEFDPNYKGSGTIIRKAFDKYGIENFEVILLEECFNKDSLNQQERFWIAKYDAANSDMFYNISNGGAGFGGLSGSKNPATRPDVRLKMSQNHADVSGDKNPNYGKSLSQEQRNILSEYAKKHYKGEGNPMFGRTGTNSPHYGKIHITNGSEEITIPKEEFSRYEALGYVKAKNKGTSGKIYLNNGVNSIIIDKEFSEEYLSKGWSLGKKNLPIIRNY